MTLTTIAFCHHCKWRSSESPIDYNTAGATCPTCGCGISALHCDPSYVGTDSLGRHYVEAQAINEHLAGYGVTTVNPAGVTIPQHPKTH